jgi:Family of unknown function (DUF6065)
VSSQSESDTLAGVKPPLVTFHRFVPQARLPQRADRSAIGTMPTRAFRYCEAIVSASAFGYYVFPPITFSLMWDGSGVIWTWEGESNWYPLHVAQFPGFREIFDSAAPEEMREFSPPFLGAMQEPGIVQVWSGFVARTAPGWSLLIRPLANLPHNQSYELYEGIVETDRWFGPLFTNMRLTKTDVPIEFRADFPLFQVQPIPRDLYADQTLNNFQLVGGLESLEPEDWDDYYETVVRPNVQTDRPRGQYAAAARKRRAGEERDLSR